MESDPASMCALLVALPEVAVIGIVARPGEPLFVYVEQTGPGPWCRCCGGPSKVKDRDQVLFADLPCFGRPTRLVWQRGVVDAVGIDREHFVDVCRGGET